MTSQTSYVTLYKYVFMVCVFFAL